MKLDAGDATGAVAAIAFLYYCWPARAERRQDSQETK